jgi:hypothetical protein
MLAAGLLGGLVVLGVGGRIAMRIVAYTTPEPERFTLTGTLTVLGVGAAWGALTAPLLLLARPSLRDRQWLGPAFGAVVLGLALVLPGLALLSGGRLVAPAAFIVASAILFPALFLLHGTLVVWLARRWEPDAREP